MLHIARRPFHRAIALDLGNAYTRVSVPARGLSLEEPSVVAFREGRALAVGGTAKRMSGRTPPGISVVRPLSGGAIRDPGAAEVIVRELVRRGLGPRRRGFDMLATIPAGTTDPERRALEHAAGVAGAGRVWLLEEPMAAAIGSGVDVADTVGSMLVDVGGGVTEGVVVALGGLVAVSSRRVGGDDLAAALVSWIAATRRIEVGEATAERLLTSCGEDPVRFGGRDLETGLPTGGSITPGEIDEAVGPVTGRIVAVALAVLEQTPPALLADVADRGVVLTGGASRLRGLARAIRSATGIGVVHSRRPDHDVIAGSSACLLDPRILESALS